MNQNTELLLSIRSVIRLYDRQVRAAGQRYGLGQTEVDVLAFLFNNPGRDTARDIVALRMLPKGSVSQTVEALIRRGLLRRRQDEADRRRIHLALTEEAQPIAEALAAAQREFQSALFRGFSPAERAQYEAFCRRVFENAAGALKGSEPHDQ